MSIRDSHYHCCGFAENHIQDKHDADRAYGAVQLVSGELFPITKITSRTQRTYATPVGDASGSETV